MTNLVVVAAVEVVDVENICPPVRTAAAVVLCTLPPPVRTSRKVWQETRAEHDEDTVCWCYPVTGNNLVNK